MRKSLVLHFALPPLALLSVAATVPAPAEGAKFAARAEKALSKQKHDAAVEQAEAAVAVDPDNARFRMLLGRAYLQSGRYRSAATSFGDALALEPSNAFAALNLVLTRIGSGDLAGARTALAEHGDKIPAGDRGLALALAGDTAAAVPVLEAVVRNGGADAKTRQNLALSYALAGRWAEARLMASYDLDSTELTRRMLEWTVFATEGQAPSQVAALLGVKPVADAGQPERLALSRPTSEPVLLAEIVSSPPPPFSMTDSEAVETSSAEVEASFTPVQQIVFAPRSEIVQAIETPAEPAPVQAEAREAPRPSLFMRPKGGDFVVQVGAYDSLGVAEDAWGRMAARIAAFRDLTPSTATYVKSGASFVRLSVGGFATRGAAVSFCELFRTRGGKCFVREQAGDKPLQWAGRGGGTKLAAR